MGRITRDERDWKRSNNFAFAQSFLLKRLLGGASLREARARNPIRPWDFSKKFQTSCQLSSGMRVGRVTPLQDIRLLHVVDCSKTCEFVRQRISEGTADTVSTHEAACVLPRRKNQTTTVRMRPWVDSLCTTQLDSLPQTMLSEPVHRPHLHVARAAQHDDRWTEFMFNSACDPNLV